MGVLNVTPDSFSDGGLFNCEHAAIAHAGEMISSGADILDIGGESTRPATFQDHEPLSVAEELRRVVPIVRALRYKFPHVPISIDTYKAEVAAAAFKAGATIINDVSALRADSGMPALASQLRCPVVLMHTLGMPRDIPTRPVYDDVVAAIKQFFEERTDAAIKSGIERSRLILDPGIGFGKTAEHNLTIFRRLPEIAALGYPVLVGPSRKRFIGKVLGGDDPMDRVEGTSAAVALSIAGGAEIVRIHDVGQMARVVRMSDAIVRGWSDPANRDTGR